MPRAQSLPRQAIRWPCQSKLNPGLNATATSLIRMEYRCIWRTGTTLRLSLKVKEVIGLRISALNYLGKGGGGGDI